MDVIVNAHVEVFVFLTPSSVNVTIPGVALVSLIVKLVPSKLFSSKLVVVSPTAVLSLIVMVPVSSLDKTTFFKLVNMIPVVVAATVAVSLYKSSTQHVFRFVQSKKISSSPSYAAAHIKLSASLYPAVLVHKPIAISIPVVV